MKPLSPSSTHIALLSLALLAALAGGFAMVLTLERVAQAIHWFYPAVAETTPQLLATQLAQQPAQVLLLDARSSEEFEVSHLPSALRVEPNASAEALLAQLGTLDGRPVVVYCAVGGRSAVLSARTQQALRDAGASSVAHLRGGIFAWQAAGLPLLKAGEQPTQQVHPYNAFWGRLRQPPKPG